MLEINHLDANFVLVFAKQLLGIIGAIEVFALCIFAGAGVVAANDEMRATVVLRISACQTASRGPAMRMARLSSDIAVVDCGYLSNTAS